jgi:hypothetical protein
MWNWFASKMTGCRTVKLVYYLAEVMYIGWLNWFATWM